MICLAFRVILKERFELEFSISKKPCFYGQTLHGYEIFFSRFLLFSMYKNTSESISPCFGKTSNMSQQLWTVFNECCYECVIILQLIRTGFPAFWLANSQSVWHDTGYLFQLLQKVVHFSSFRCSGIGNSQISIKLLSCLISGHFNTRQTVCKH